MAAMTIGVDTYARVTNDHASHPKTEVRDAMALKRGLLRQLRRRAQARRHVPLLVCRCTTDTTASLASLAEHPLSKREIVGSNPTGGSELPL